MNIKGVNLGNWLVLEKWMSPAIWEGTDAEDEYYLPMGLSKEVYEARIRMHRAEYISERDFARIKKMGMNSVRIPIPYFIFGDRPPFIGCINELDKAFTWAEKYDLKILIDLHTAPMSQNGFDNGGLSGVCKWAQLPNEVEYVLDVLEKLAKRYGNRAGLLGIEPINEPISEEMWESMAVQKRYPPVDEQLAKGSAPISFDWLTEFYDKAAERILPNVASDKYIVFHDGFRLHAWKEYLSQEKYKNRVILDTHQYLMIAEVLGCEKSLDAYIKFIQENFEKDIEAVQQYVPVVVGEWCIFNSYCVGQDTKGGQSVLNGIDTADAISISKEEKKDVYMKLSECQLKAWEKGSGYFYWTYKMLLDPTNEPSWRGWDCWDLAKCVDEGWFPERV
ncbi:Aryl-phospho-beta-D-glucosidase BglC, GH1 family [Pseudobutyrivibrio sp. ACV-2]|uniref:glycoside hydrolase family 5 protein n=1 Tax=Pseudobutyrivibrio sp. ACV-2 TaxID=1520801 RepID=UPI00089B0633|nr:cellulase family glycosylhydrolase [Pseudobutyrivibrio sp. ACV-2]SEA91196.1 Aryl-phospho-beta-D-glucosidase BglC, GH1 family [Pseudobutyrivibrio sp. ACV-2]